MAGSTSGTTRPARPAAGANHPLRRLRRRRGLTQGELGELAGLSCSYISMVENGQRTMARLDHIAAVAAVLKVSPAELAPDTIAAHPDLRASAAPAPASAFPALRNEVTMTRHVRMVGEFLAFVARRDTRAAGMWLRRTARDPAVSPWLLLDLIATQTAWTPERSRGGAVRQSDIS